ncbi:MAG: ABC transporter permease [Chloroflexi bacterium]|nr:MAG: ABC transporter permease [Chloroflexota bacterium]HEY72092.1 ABC transporter permease [Thermoflexia bacterium]
MQRFIVQRILWNIPVLLLISVVTFGMMQLVPGGPFSGSASGRPVPPEIRANMEAKYGLDKPVWQQYLSYMDRLLLHFDFGPSLRRPGRTVTSMLFGPNYMVEVLRDQLRASYDVQASSMTFAEPPGLFDSEALVVKTNREVVGYIGINWRTRLDVIKRFFSLAPVMVSAQVGLVSVCMALLIGVPLGIVSALKQNSAVDYVAMFFSMLGVSVPNFLLGILLILVFALTLEWLPTYGWGENWKQVILPAITLGTGGMAIIARLTRASMLEVIRADYIRTARAKGLTEQVVIVRHALKNSLIPVTTVLGPLMAAWLTGSFMVEWVFSIGGIGKFFVSAVTDRDYTLIMGTIIIYSGVLVLFNLIVDVAYGFIDPRIRFD